MLAHSQPTHRTQARHKASKTLASEALANACAHNPKSNTNARQNAGLVCLRPHTRIHHTQTRPHKKTSNPHTLKGGEPKQAEWRAKAKLKAFSIKKRGIAWNIARSVGKISGGAKMQKCKSQIACAVFGGFGGACVLGLLGGACVLGLLGGALRGCAGNARYSVRRGFVGGW